MADKWQDLAGRLKNAGGGGAPRGLGLGIKLLAGGIAAAYGLQQSMYTGQDSNIYESSHYNNLLRVSAACRVRFFRK